MRNLIAIIAVLTLSAVSCMRQAPSEDTAPAYAVMDSLRMKWNAYNRSGDYDSIVMSTRSLFRESVKEMDTVSMLYAAMVTAQAYLFSGEMDSAGYYIRLAVPMKEAVCIPELRAGLEFVEGTYAMKAELDYLKALNSYLTGYDWIEHDNDVDNQIVFLSNIVHIFLYAFR